MRPSGDRPRIPFPPSTERPLTDASTPRSMTDNPSEDAEASGRRAMDIDQAESTPTKRLPSIQNLFGIARQEPLASVRRSSNVSAPESVEQPPQQGLVAPTSPAASQSSAMSRSPTDEHSMRNFAGTLSGPSSSLGPIRTKHSSNVSPYSRSSNTLPSTPPRHTRGAASLTMSPEETALRRVDSRSRQAQNLKGLILSPPSRRLPLDHDSHNDLAPPSQRRYGHRPASSSSGSLSTMFSHISTSSDSTPMLPPGYPSSTQTSLESVPYEGWGASSAGSTSPRTSWHSRSSTLESAESAYKMTGGERGQAPLLPPYRDPMHPGGEAPMLHPAERSQSSLSRHRSLRTPGVTANLPSGQQRPRARTLTHADRPIAPLPNSDDPSRRQKLEAASELLRMGQQPSEAYPGRQSSHKHSSSMHERQPMPAEFYENANVVRTHRSKSHSLSIRNPAELGRPMPPPGMYFAGPSGAPYDRAMPPATPMDSSQPHRQRGAVDDNMRPPPGGAGWVFPRRPMPAETAADAQRNAFQAQLMRGHGLASVPDGIISGHPPMAGTARNAGTTGTIASGQAKYECAWCGKRFSRPSSLKIHHHSHTGEKPFVCNEPGCGRSFSVQSNLRRHQKCHTPGGDSSETGSVRSQVGSASGPGDEASWTRGPPSLASSSASSRMSPIAGPSAWHSQYRRGHAHSQSLGQMPSKDHPPLSRSAFEPGSRSMTTWSERGHDPLTRDDERRWQAYDPTSSSSSPRRYTQMRERGLSSSSNEEDELEYEEAEAEAAAARAAATVTTGMAAASGTTPSHSGPEEEAEEDEEYDRTITNTEPQTRRRSATGSSSTSGLSVGFGSLLNPTTTTTTKQSSVAGDEAR